MPAASRRAARGRARAVAGRRRPPAPASCTSPRHREPRGEDAARAKPRSICCSAPRLRSISPAPITRTTASATSATTSALPQPPAAALPVVRPPASRSARRVPRCRARSAGAGRRGRSSAARQQRGEARTPGGRCRHGATRGMPAGPRAASVRPGRRPARGRGGAGDREDEALGEELADEAAAPGAERRAHGDLALPRLARASSRFATLAHAISSRKPTAPSSSEERRAHGAQDLLRPGRPRRP